MSERSTGVIILGILAIAGLGLSGYMFAKYEFLSPVTDNGSILVGSWEDLYRNMDYAPYDEDVDWLLELGNGQSNNSNFISCSNDNTRFTLLRTGCYKLTLHLYLANIQPDTHYYVHLLRNGDTEHIISKISTTANPFSSYYHTVSSLFFTSNSGDYFEIRCTSSTLALALSITQTLNQFSIEYYL